MKRARSAKRRGTQRCRRSERSAADEGKPIQTSETGVKCSENAAPSERLLHSPEAAFAYFVLILVACICFQRGTSGGNRWGVIGNPNGHPPEH